MGRISTSPLMATGRSIILCIPKIPDWGGLMIGVDNMEPKTPPLEMVKVPPVMSSTVISPSLARIASRVISCSIYLKDKFSAPLKTGTIKPLGPDTATLMSQ